MSKFRRLVWCVLLCMLPMAASAKPEPIIPIPPEYVLDKQLEGEDPYEVAKAVFSPDNAYAAAARISILNPRGRTAESRKYAHSERGALE